jgi:hypothetical protein
MTASLDANFTDKRTIDAAPSFVTLSQAVWYRVSQKDLDRFTTLAKKMTAIHTKECTLHANNSTKTQ